MPLKTMFDLLVGQLNELCAAEKHSAMVLPKLAEAASSPELASVFRSHADESRKYLSRLASVLDDLGIKHGGPACDESGAMKGLCEDCLKLAGMSSAEPYVRDAALIAVAQHLVHDEIAGYGCARAWTALLGHGGAAFLLQNILADQRKMDRELTRLSATVNRAALLVANG